MRKSKKLVRGLSMAMATSMIVSSSGMSALAAAPEVIVESEDGIEKDGSIESDNADVDADTNVDGDSDVDVDIDADAQVAAMSEVIDEKSDDLDNQRKAEATAKDIQNMISSLLGTVDVQLTGTTEEGNKPSVLLAEALNEISSRGYGAFEFLEEAEALTPETTRVEVHFVEGFKDGQSDDFSTDDSVTSESEFFIDVNVKGISLTASELAATLEKVEEYVFVTSLDIQQGSKEVGELLNDQVENISGIINDKLAVSEGFSVEFKDRSAIINENMTSIPVVVTITENAQAYYAAGAGWTTNEDGSITTTIDVPLSLKKLVTSDIILNELKTNLGLDIGVSHDNISLGESTFKLDAAGTPATIADHFELPTSKYGTWTFDDPTEAAMCDVGRVQVNFEYNEELNKKGYEAEGEVAGGITCNLIVKINKAELRSGVDYLLPNGYNKETAVLGAELADVELTYSDSDYNPDNNKYVDFAWVDPETSLKAGTNTYAYTITLKSAADLKFANETDDTVTLNKTISITTAEPKASVTVADVGNVEQGVETILTAEAAIDGADLASTDNWEVGYQWYKMVNGTKTKIDGAISKSYTAPTSILGKTTYICDVTFRLKSASPELLSVYGSFDGKTVYSSEECTVNVTAIILGSPQAPNDLIYDNIDSNAEVSMTYGIETLAEELGYKAGKYEWTYKKEGDLKGQILKNGDIDKDIIDGILKCNIPVNLTAGTYEFTLTATAVNSKNEEITADETITVEVGKAEITLAALPTATGVYGQSLADTKLDLTLVTNAFVKNNGTFSWVDEKLVPDRTTDSYSVEIKYTLNDSDNYAIKNEAPDAKFAVREINIPVSKADLTVKANDVEITTSDKLPDAETVAEGLVLNDTLKKLGITAKAEYAENADATKPGTYDIVVTLTDAFGETISETDNYNLKTVNGTLTVKAVEVSEVKLNKTAITFDTIGAAEAIKATVAPDNAVDKTVTYTSSNSKVATVDADGIVKAVGNGSAVITAKAGNASAVCNVKVSQKASQISISDSTVTFNKLGDTKKLTVSAAPSNADLSIAKWSTSNGNVVSVDGNGTVKAVADGTAVITVEVGNVKATSTITVVTKTTGLTLSTSSVVFDKIGDTRTVTASVTPANSSSVTWSTSNGNVATVSAGGVITAIGNGTAVITAKAGDISKTVNVTVNQKATGLTLSTSKVSFDKIGDTKTVTASVTPANSANVAWSTSNSKVATVSASGVIKAVGNGTATITAKAGDLTKTVSVKVSQKTSKVSITYKKTTVSGTVKVTKGKSYNLDSVVTPTNASKENAKVTWKTSNKKIATVSSTGTVKIKGTGTVTITATTADGKKASVKLKSTTATVKATKVKVTGSKTMKVKGKQTLKVTVSPVTVSNSKVKWTTSNKKIATVNSKGVVTARKAGTVKITATSRDGSGKKSTITIKVKK